MGKWSRATESSGVMPLAVVKVMAMMRLAPKDPQKRFKVLITHHLIYCDTEGPGSVR